MDLFQIVSSAQMTNKILRPEVFKNQNEPKIAFLGW
jgi:hypothetical protein